MFNRRSHFLAAASWVALGVLALGAGAVRGQEKKEGKMDSAKSELQAVMATSKGDIHLRLFADKTPLTVANFVNLAQRGFYDGIKFHRVIPDFMVQGGDPEGSGRGGPGYQFADETRTDLKHGKAGILSMANSGPNTNGSQFFITHKETSHLDGRHTVFGEVMGPKDQEVVNKIKQGDAITSIKIEGDTSELFKKAKTDLDGWNKTLDKKYPRKK